MAPDPITAIFIPLAPPAVAREALGFPEGA
jgi:hypothetical protein